MATETAMPAKQRELWKGASCLSLQQCQKNAWWTTVCLEHDCLFSTTFWLTSLKLLSDASFKISFVLEAEHGSPLQRDKQMKQRHVAMDANNQRKQGGCSEPEKRIMAIYRQIWAWTQKFMAEKLRDWKFGTHVECGSRADWDKKVIGTRGEWKYDPTRNNTSSKAESLNLWTWTRWSRA